MPQLTGQRPREVDWSTLPIARLGARSSAGGEAPANVTLNCPHCRHVGTFQIPHGWEYKVEHQVGTTVLAQMVNASVRFCPNTKCRAPVFVISSGTKVLHSLPRERIDFDADGLPEVIATSLEEAISCHAAACYRASALMVRRTIEEVCKDKGATGKNLKERIASLGTVMTLPAALLAAMDELRLLGNDAAHVEAATYDNVGAQEAAVAVMLAKEIVKAGYQYDKLLGALSSLRKQSGSKGANQP